MPIKSILKKNTKNFSATNNGQEFISNFAKQSSQPHRNEISVDSSLTSSISSYTNT